MPSFIGKLNLHVSSALAGLVVVVALLAGLADPSEARRVRFGSSGGSSSGSIEKVYELPRIPELTMPDGRSIDIGRIKGGKDDGKLVGYVGPGREYLNLPYEAMTELVGHAGFDSVEALERHLAAEKEARIEAHKAEREAKGARGAEAAEEKRRKRAEARQAAGVPAGGEEQRNTRTGDRQSSTGVGYFGGILALIVIVIVFVFAGVFSLWPLIILGVVIWLVVRAIKGKPSAAPKPAAAVVSDEAAVANWVERSSRRMPQGAAAASGPLASVPSNASAGSFAALAGSMPVAVRHTDGSTSQVMLRNPEDLAALLGKPSPKPAGSSVPTRAAVAQPVSRRGARDGRIAQPAAFGKRG